VIFFSEIPRFALSSAIGCALLLALKAASAQEKQPMDSRFHVGPVLFQDEFKNGLGQWQPELENGGKVEAQNGRLIVDVPAGCTVWFKPLIEGPVMIQYEATVISASGTNDRVSDLNCFWMARDARSPQDIFAIKRSGKFADYDQLRCYYVGLGGNSNTTTRFRRYIGEKSNRPLLPEHDLRDKKDLIAPNVPQLLSLVACGSLIQFYRDDQKLFELTDPEPYASGWFAFRTVTSHLEIQHFQIHRLQLVSPASRGEKAN
jgi:hypothetical protein